MSSFQDNWSNDFKTQKNSRTSNPITLVDVYLGEQESVDGNTLFFNDSNYSLEFWPYRDMQLKQSYVALGLVRGSISRSIDSSFDSVQIMLDNVSRTFSTLFTTTDFRGKRIVIREVYGDLLTNSGDFDLLFDGILDKPGMSLEEGVRIDAKPSISESLEVKIPRELFKAHCPNLFTGTECANAGMAAATLLDKKESQTIDSVVNQTQFIDAARTEANTYYNPGIIEMTGGTAANIGEKRRVVEVSGDNFFIEKRFSSDVEAGDEYSIERDCDRTFEECKDKFSNDANFRGHRYIPQTLTQKKN